MRNGRPGLQASPSRRAWALLALLTLLNILNFLDRQLIATLAPLLIAELDLTRAQIGLLVGFAFVGFYSLMGLLLGAAADRVSRPRLIAIGLALWSLMTAASGRATTFVHLAIPRMLVAVGEATLTPAALSMMADEWPSARLGLATGIYYAGIPVGTALSLLLAGWVAPAYGWRACFYILGFAGLAVVALLLLVRDPRERAPATDGGPPGPQKDTEKPSVRMIAAAVSRLLTGAPTYGLTILGGALLAYWSASAQHTVTWLVEERHFSFAAAAYSAGLIAVASGLLGNLAGGWFADFCHRRWPGGRLWSLVIITLTAAPFTLSFYVMAPGSPQFYVCWFVMNVAATTYFGPLFAILQDLSPARIRSSAVAVGLLGVNVLGVGPGPWITGMIGDSSSLTRGLIASLAVGCISVVPFGIGALRYERDARRLQGL